MKENAYKIPYGTMDILPAEMPYWHYLEKTARAVFERYAYREIRTPLFEETRLFNRSIGDATDIVSKEMYHIYTTDSGDIGDCFANARNDSHCEETQRNVGMTKQSNLSLRPEFTASVVRAYIGNNLHKIQAFQKLYSIGAAFRHERPQKGRYRQFHQLNIEALGSSDPLLDAEIIQIPVQMLTELGIDKYEVKLNSLGCPKCREDYRAVLTKHLSGSQSELCHDCQTRFTKNIFRVFDCKNDKCAKIAAGTQMSDYLCADCRSHFDKVKSGLSALNVNYRLEPKLVRGLDYYTRTVFEVTSPVLGAQDALGGGGRYDNLIESLGGPALGAVGCAFGMERIIITLQSIESLKKAITSDQVTAYIATFDDTTRQKGFELLANLRKNKISAEIDYENRSIKSQMRQASKLNAKFVVIIGPDELAKDSAKIKNMSPSGGEESIAFSQITDYFKRTTFL